MKYFYFLFFFAILISSAHEVYSHGTMTNPVSRIYNCFLENPENPKSEACKQAVAVGGKQALYDWNGVNQANANDMHMNVVPDGDLCGGGNELFKGMNLARNDWHTSNISPDQNGEMDFVFRATAPHSTEYFDFYITKDGYKPLVPLKWSDLEPIPFCSIKDVVLENGNYNMKCPFPSNKSGKQVIYNIWQRDDSTEAFYTCIDVAIGEVFETEYKSIGAIRAQQDLSTGDRVTFRLFDENFSDLETISVTLGVGQVNADEWPYELASRINQSSNFAKAGVLNTNGDIIPVKNSQQNEVYIPSDQNYNFQVDIEMIDNPGGDDDDDCNCEDTGTDPGTGFNFVYPEGLGGYTAGTVVKARDGNLYECKPFPFSGWCNGLEFYYEPSSGLAWQDAWTRLN